MIHKQCSYCKKIGHLPELEKYFDPGYINYPFSESRKYGIKYYHRECFMENMIDFRKAIWNQAKSNPNGQ
jgi:hypothetical protein